MNYQHTQNVIGNTRLKFSKIGPPGNALDASSYAWAWGDNSLGQLGNGTTITKSSAVSVLGARQWKHLSWSAGTDSSLYAWTWGNNDRGQLGDGTTINRSSPVSVVGGRQWLTLDRTSSSQANVGIDSNSYALAWGINDQGACGDGTTINRSSPVSVVGGRQFRQVVAGVQSTFALDLHSYAWAWGSNFRGQLGDGTTINRSSPVSVLGGRQWRSLGSMVAIDQNSYAWAWGPNDQGACGDGTTINRSSPVSVVGGRQWVKVVSGEENWVSGSSRTRQITLDSKSHTWVWGLVGPLVITSSNISQYSSPVSVNTDQMWTDIAAAGNNILALDADYDMFAWGVAAPLGGLNSQYPLAPPSRVITNIVSITNVMGKDDA